jgi:beta-N-acetylhexosaminidase
MKKFMKKINGSHGSSNLLIVAEALILIAVIFLCFFGSVFHHNEKKSIVSKSSGKKASESKDTAKSEKSPVKETAFKDEKTEFDSDIEEKIAGLSDEEKAACLFLVTPEDFTGNQTVEVAGKGTKDAIDKYPISGMLLSKSNLLGKGSTKGQLANLKSYGISRNGENLFLFSQSGEGNEDITDKSYMKDNGLNGLILPDDPDSIIKNDDPASSIKNSITSYQSEGLMALLPYRTAGTGNESNDDSYKEAFKKATGEAWGFLTISSMDSLSKTGSSDLASITAIRNDFSYKGLLASKFESDGSDKAGLASVNAINAGADLIIINSGFKAAYDQVLSSIKDGTIDENRLHNAIGHIFSLKKTMAGN